MMFRISLFILLSLYPASLLAEQSSEAIDNLEFTGSDAYSKLRHNGYEVLKEKQILVSGDRKDVFVVARSERGLALFAYKRGASGFVLLSRSSDLPGDELAGFDSIELGDRRGIFFKVMEDSPDEAAFYATIFLLNPSGLYPVLKTNWEQLHSEAEAGREPVKLVDLGALPLGLTLEQGKGAGQWPVAVLRTQPKILPLGTHRAMPTMVMVGCQTEIFIGSPMGFKRTFRGFQEYLSPVKNLHAAADGPGETQDLYRLLDNKADTTWTPGKPTLASVQWGQAVAIRALMLMPCQGLEDQLKRFDLRFGDGTAISVDRTNPEQVDERLLGFEDFKSAQGKIQTLLFFDPPILTKSLSVLVHSDSVCIAEIRPLSSLLDQKRAHKGP